MTIILPRRALPFFSRTTMSDDTQGMTSFLSAPDGRQSPIECSHDPPF